MECLVLPSRVRYDRGGEMLFFLDVGLSMVQEGVLIVLGPYTTNA